MISALLLPLILGGEPVTATAARSLQDDPPIQIWISNDRRFLPGEEAKVEVRAEDDGYLLVLHVDPDGYLRVLFPLDPDKDNFVRGGKKYEVRGRGDRRAFEADAKGRGTVYAAVSREPFRFETFVVGDHWDYRTLAPSRLSSNPEPELTELVRRMAQGDFDYDILGYEVVERASYAADYYPRYYSGYYGDPWCYSFSCGRYYGSSITIFFGRPYRRYYYDPYFYAYDPFYNPFFYDPYYYAPAYYPRYVFPRHYYYPYFYHNPYRGRSYFDGHRGFGQPYTPNRDRRYDLRRSVNTVYYPPISPVRPASTATPARRVVEGSAEQLPNNAAPRRLVDDARRVVGRPVEARRAQPQERVQERSAGEPRLIRREAESRPSSEERRSEPRPERGREAPRSIERPAEPRRAPASEARPQRSAPPDRGVRGSEGRSSGGGARQSGGSRPSNDGARRRR